MRREPLHPVLRTFLIALATIAIVLVAWEIIALVAPPRIAKGPLDVWNHLFVDKANLKDPADSAASVRAALSGLVGVTLGDAGLGFVTGMVIAIVLAVLFSMSRTIEAGVMPFALFLRTVPLVALAPVIVLITGSGSAASVAVITAIVVLFPALASVLFGLAQASPQSLDLVDVFGGGRWMQLAKVTLPSAVPSIFAAARISVPAAMTGALLAEWLSTGHGIGGQLVKYTSQAKYLDLWTAVAAITLVTIVIYNLVAIAERSVLASMHMSQAADR